jgi:hypothetical protein
MCSGMKNKALIIADSLKEYLGEQPHMHLKDFANYAGIGKNGIQSGHISAICMVFDGRYIHV